MALGMQQGVVIAAGIQLELGRLGVAVDGVGLEHMQLEDLCAVLLAEVQVGAQAEVEASGLVQPPALG
jgi:hypothetical protein